MALNFIKSRDDSSEDVVDDDFVELDAKRSESDEKVVIRAETLTEFGDVEAVQEHLRNDHIVWVNIKPLKKKDMADLKRAVKRLKKTIKAVEGDMAGVDEEWIVVCPGYATIARTGDKIEGKE